MACLNETWKGCPAGSGKKQGHLDVVPFSRRRFERFFQDVDRALSSLMVRFESRRNAVWAILPFGPFHDCFPAMVGTEGIASPFHDAFSDL